jgi:hypothetical protein
MSQEIRNLEPKALWNKNDLNDLLKEDRVMRL